MNLPEFVACLCDRYNYKDVASLTKELKSYLSTYPELESCTAEYFGSTRKIVFDLGVGVSGQNLYRVISALVHSGIMESCLLILGAGVFEIKGREKSLNDAAIANEFFMSYRAHEA